MASYGSIWLVLTPSYPCMDEYKPRLSSTLVVNTDNLVTYPLDKHRGIGNKNLSRPRDFFLEITNLPDLLFPPV